MERRLAAILMTDMVGYSRLMGLDEASAIARQKAHRTDIIDPKISEYGGRIVKTTGDGLLVEFSSVVAAVQCALKVQQSIAEHEAEVPQNRRIQYRIGINLGDIVIDGDDILGDGVNVAARLEGLAKPGGICISGAVHDQLAGKSDIVFEDAGEQTVRNVPRPVRVWHWQKDRGTRDAIDTSEPLPLPDQPSIAVLPFSNFSGNKQDDFIGMGVAKDLITTLAKVPQLFVVSRVSSFGFKNKNVTAAEIAEQLGIRYIVEGSIQRSGEKIRINAQLIDAVTGHHLWAENFDGMANDLFSFQDDIVRRILVELQVKLISGEHARLASRGTNNLEAWLLWVRGFDEAFKYTREGLRHGRELFQAAHELDRKWARPLVGLSWTYWYGARQGWTDKHQEGIRKGIELAEKAVSLAPNESGGYQMLGFLAQLQGDHDRAIALREKAFELAPGDFFVIYGLAIVLTKSGQPKRALEYYKQARRLSPRMTPKLLGAIAEAQLLASAFEEAITTSKAAINLEPKLADVHVFLAAAHRALDRMDEARSEAAEVLRLAPGFTVSAWLKTRTYKEEGTNNQVAGLLVDAGLPE